MDRLLNALDTISGREGRAYVKLDGMNEELFFARSISAKIEKTKAAIKAVGKRMVGHKTTAMEGTGSMRLYYLSPIFREKIKTYLKTGQDIYFDMVVENEDPTSRAGRQSVLLLGCNLDSQVLTLLDGESDTPLEEKVTFTFEDFEIMEAFKLR